MLIKYEQICSYVMTLSCLFVGILEYNLGFCCGHMAALLVLSFLPARDYSSCTVKTAFIVSFFCHKDKPSLGECIMLAILPNIRAGVMNSTALQWVAWPSQSHAPFSN